MTKILFTATVVKTHIIPFHLPFIAWCREQGWETSVAAHNDFEDEHILIPNCDAYYDVPFARSPFSLKNIKAYRQLKHIIDANNYDIIHCNTPVAGILTRIAARRTRKRGTKVIYMAHGFHFYKGAPLLNWLLYYPAEKHFAKDTDVLVLINQEDYASAKNRRFKAEKIEYLPGVGVDTGRFAPRGLREAARKALGVSEDTMVLLSVGELIPRKNHALILRALAAAADERLHYYICGSGELKDRLQKEIETLGLSKHVKLLGFRRDIPELCEAADIFVFPSLQEGLPVALMEAMAAGLPCVASDVRGNRDLIENGKGGYLCVPNDEGDFAGAIGRLASDSELRKVMGARNKETVKAYDIGNILPRMAEIYRYCANERKDDR